MICMTEKEYERLCGLLLEIRREDSRPKRRRNRIYNLSRSAGLIVTRARRRSTGTE